MGKASKSKKATSMVFVVRRCESCMGNGCMSCGGLGMIGSLEEVPALEGKKPCSFMADFSKWRRSAGMTLREVHLRTSLRPSVVSSFERGYSNPNENDISAMKAIMLETTKGD